MLFRPTAEQSFDTIHAVLDAWNGEADHFRRAAIAARRGETPTSLTVAAAEEAHDDLISLLAEIEAALAKATAGSPPFTALLQSRLTAIALLESVGNSWDILESVATEQMTAPRRIVHELRATAAAAS